METSPSSLSFTSCYPGLSLELKNEVFIHTPFGESEHLTAPPENKFLAIWDTGATGCVITKKVVDQCSLKHITFRRVFTAGDQTGEGQLKPLYLVSIFLPNHVVFHAVEAIEGTIIGADVLIGMCIINKGDFAVTNKDGKTEFTFRIPSIERIDFTSNRPVVINRGPGRNNPCPCGSGKKYKHCCGKSA